MRFDHPSAIALWPIWFLAVAAVTAACGGRVDLSTGVPIDASVETGGDSAAVDAGFSDARPESASAGGCHTDGDCAGETPPTSPPGCATGSCDTRTGACIFTANDEDGDQHASAHCASMNGVPIVIGDDCNDLDPNLYPGHPESCDTAPDGGAPPVGFCQGQIRCLPGGSESPCIATVTCAGQACVAGSCQGSCAPGQTQCEGAQVSTCTSTGSWGPPVTCAVGSCVGGSCMGSCIPGRTRCASTVSIQTCDATGAWGSAVRCNGTTPTCCGESCTDESSDPSNCGACGNACNLTPQSQCGSGVCSYTLYSGPPQAVALAADATSVYFTTSPGGVLRMPLTGGPPVTLASGPGSGDSIVVDATNVYWTAEVTAANWNVLQMPLLGGAPTTLVTGLPSASSVAVDTTSVYFGSGYPASGSEWIGRVPIGGGSVVTLVSGQPLIGDIALGASAVYWTAATYFGAVLSAPIAGGTASTVASSQNPIALALDTSNLYWTSGTGVMEVALAGGTPTSLGRIVSGQPYGLATDGTNVYWTDAPGVVKVPVNGGTPTPVATDSSSPQRIALGGTQVFWTDSIGNLMTAPK